MLLTQPTTTTSKAPSVAESTAQLDSLNLGEWQVFVDKHPESTIFHHRKWIETIQEHYGWESFIPCLKSGGEVLAAAPFLSCRSMLGAKKLVSLPYSDYLRLLGWGPRDVESLAHALVREHPPCDSLSLRTDTALEGVPSTSHAVRHEVPLDASAESLWNSYKPSIHRNIRKAQRAGLQFVKRTDPQAMDAFYRLHVLTRRKLGVPVQPKSFFDRLQQNIVAAGLGYVGLVGSGTQPVAAAVYLAFNGTVTYKYAASDPAALAERPNDLLVYESMRLAAEEGYDAFDFGISDRKHEGLRRFKRQWGASEIDVHTIQLVGRDRPPKDESPAFKLAGFVIRNSPAFVCRGLGQVFYRFAQ